MNSHISQLMSKEVSRKEFLGMSGLAIASIFGFGTVIKLLTGHSITSNSSRVASGYGNSTYGGTSTSFSHSA